MALRRHPLGSEAAASLPAEMTAAVVDGTPGHIAFACVPVPTPGPGEILVRVAACGLCHSDLHIVDGDWTLLLSPLVPGHEIVGTVVAQGTGVTGPALGATVGVAWLGAACGECVACLDGLESVCLAKTMTGFNRDGGFAEYVVATADFVVELPADVDPVALAPVLCAGLTGYRGLKRTDAIAGQSIAIVGAGGLGHLAIQYARAMGLDVVAVDVSAEKLALAGRLGAGVTIDARAGDAAAAVRMATGGGAHAALVTAPSRAAAEAALAMLRPGGTCVVVGLPSDGDALTVSMSGLSGHERTLRGSNIGTRRDLREAVGAALDGTVAAIVEAVPMSRAADALDRLRRGTVSGRLVLVPDFGGA